MGGRPPITTVRGYDLGEVVSALQKAIRRGEEERAVYWAGEMVRSGYGEYLWKRLKVILSEDIGIAAPPGFAADIRALYDNWKDFHAKKDGLGDLMVAHAVMLMARVEKSHAALHATMWIYWTDHMPRIEIPDEAIDRHTRRGRSLGRGGEHFLRVGGRLNNERPELDNPTMRDLWERGIRHDDDKVSLGPRCNPPRSGKAAGPAIADEDEPEQPPAKQMAFGTNGT